MRHRFVRTGVFQGAKLYNCNGSSVFCPIQTQLFEEHGSAKAGAINIVSRAYARMENWQRGNATDC